MLLKKKKFLAVKPSGGAAPTKIQTTGKVSASTSVLLNITLATPPIVGNSVVVPLVIANFSGGTFTCADNRGGNTYNLITQSASSSAPHMFVIFHCGNIINSGGPFTITVTATVGFCNYHGCAIELGGKTVLDRLITNIGSTNSPNTGSTAALTGSGVFAIAGFTTQGNPTTGITVQSVTPIWFQEVESLTNTPVAGEINSRALTGVAGTTQSCSWTFDTAANWVAVLAAFKPA